MQILKKDLFSVAIIDPSKKVGEDGQYRRFPGSYPNIEKVLASAYEAHHEVRRYVENLPAEEGIFIPLKYVITDVPPGHVQPFHRHHSVDEVNLVESGEIYFIESDSLGEQQTKEIRESGTLLMAGDVVISASGKRHTLANFSNEYAHIIGTISAKSATEDFNPDWVQ